MFGFNFREQILRRLGINRVIKPNSRFQRFEVNGAIDIQSLAAAVGFEFLFLPRLNPAIRRNAVVLGMSRISKINRVVLTLSSLNTLIGFKKRLLLDCILFARNMRRLFI